MTSNTNIEVLIELKKLAKITTIVKIDSVKDRITVFGEDFCPSRFKIDQGKPIEFNALDKYWYFSEKWTLKLQNYRLLYESTKMFFLSFFQLRFNKVSGINTHINKDGAGLVRYNDLVGVNLYGMYFHGKKCIDLLKELKLLKKSELIFVRKFAETRNKLLEHNYNPRDFSFRIEPNTWSLVATDSLMETFIHTLENEREYEAYFDYYEDYYNLEKIIVDVLKRRPI